MESGKKTDEQPEPATVCEAPQVLRRVPGKVPKWLKLPGMKSEECSSYSELPRKASSSVPSVLDVGSILEDVSIRLAGHLVQCLSITNQTSAFAGKKISECRLWALSLV